MNPLLQTDGYKLSHRQQYPEGTQLVYSNWTPRKSRIEGIDKVVHFGLQYFIKEYLIKQFNNEFFNKPKEEVVSEYKKLVETYMNCGYDVSHIEALHDLGYLPIEIMSLPEGVKVPIRCPMFTVHNTLPEFFWLTNYIETLLSAAIWQPMTSATIANKYKEILTFWANKTGGNTEFVTWQGHDFSMRGMQGTESALISGMAHLTSFTGTDTLPAMLGLIEYYNATGLICGSVPATEHSVMCAGGQEGELETFSRLLDIYPTGIVSVVSDTWDLWKVLNEYLPQLKEQILGRDGKLVIRPDSGDPVDIICGKQDWYFDQVSARTKKYDNISDNEKKGVVELLWDVFGGTINEKGYKVLDSHIGAIYGDSITLERANNICQRLEKKGFCSTNIVFGIGSFTYTFNTRDTFGFAMKATYVEINGQPIEIFKNPITDSGEKKSLKGLIAVYTDGDSYVAKDGVSWNEVRNCEWNTVFLNGSLINEYSLEDIRIKL